MTAKKLLAVLRHGLALEEDSPPNARETFFVGELAKKAKEFHLEFPLLAFAEGLRPASFLTQSLLTGLQPFAELFVSREIYAEFLEFAGKRTALDLLIEKLQP